VARGHVRAGRLSPSTRSVFSSVAMGCGLVLECLVSPISQPAPRWQLTRRHRRRRRADPGGSQLPRWVLVTLPAVGAKNLEVDIGTLWLGRSQLEALHRTRRPERLTAWRRSGSATGNPLRERSRTGTAPARVCPQHPPGEHSRASCGTRLKDRIEVSLWLLSLPRTCVRGQPGRRARLGQSPPVFADAGAGRTPRRDGRVLA
jgi:hypothetical protein